MSYEIKLEVFQGPLDLLLYLIKKNEIDIYDIPIALITRQYLEHLDKLRSLNLDLAGEYLLLAATLIHIKSKMLLPAEEEPETEEEDDPRQELVEQLLAYQTYKEAYLKIAQLPVLDKDVFKRGNFPQEEPGRKEEEKIEANLFDLIEAFQRILSSWDQAEIMEIDREKINLAEKMNEILSSLEVKDGLSLEELLEGAKTRRRLVYTFLALLELMKQRIIKAYQNVSFGPIRVYLSVA